MLQEMLGKVFPRLDEKKWMPGIILTSFLFTAAWGYLVYTGDIASIWPLFGMSNQLLATSALIICTTMLIRLGKARYAWVTAVPGIFMIPVTMSAGYLNIVNNYWPKQDWLKVGISAILMILMALVFIEAFRKWFELLRVKELVTDRYGEPVLLEVEE
jgi:carbon starvation protein